MNELAVTVVIPNMNRTHSLRKALASVASQTHAVLETIVVDDKSDDLRLPEIRSIIKEFETSANARMIELPVNGGANKARNVGIREARGSHVAFLDSDDLWLPEKTERQLKAIADLPARERDNVLSTTSRYRVNGEGRILFTHMTPSSFPLQRLKASNLLGTLSSAIVGTRAAREIGGFDETLPSCQDWDFFIRLMERCRFVGVGEPMCVYVDHDDDRITLNNRRRLKGHLRIYSKHMRHEFRAGEILRSELYRNVAEDLQGLGKKRLASRFLAGSLANKWFYREDVRRAAAAALGAWFGILPPGSISKKRYTRYNRLSLKSRLLGRETPSKRDLELVSEYL